VPPDITPPSRVAARDMKKSPADPPIVFCEVIAICAEAFVYIMEIRNAGRRSFGLILFMFWYEAILILKVFLLLANYSNPISTQLDYDNANQQHSSFYYNNVRYLGNR